MSETGAPGGAQAREPHGLLAAHTRPGHPDFLDLPWHLPLAAWPGSCPRVVQLERGLSRLLESLSGGLNVKSASGDTRAREIAGGVNIQTASGDVELDAVRGGINVASASGDVTIREAWDNVNVNTVSGDQEHGAVYQGNVSAHAVSGDVSVGVRRGSKVFLDCTTVSGDTRSELDMLPDAPSGDGPLVELRVKTVSGDIDITRAPAPADTQEVHA